MKALVWLFAFCSISTGAETWKLTTEARNYFTNRRLSPKDFIIFGLWVGLEKSWRDVVWGWLWENKQQTTTTTTKTLVLTVAYVLNTSETSSYLCESLSSVSWLSYLDEVTAECDRCSNEQAAYPPSLCCCYLYFPAMWDILNSCSWES